MKTIYVVSVEHSNDEYADKKREFPCKDEETAKTLLKAIKEDFLKTKKENDDEDDLFIGADTDNEFYATSNCIVDDFIVEIIEHCIVDNDDSINDVVNVLKANLFY